MGADNEGEAIYGRANHCDLAGSRGWSEDQGSVPEVRDFRADILQLEGEIRRHDGLGCPASEGPGDRELAA
jgi:hypothetical protein